MKVLNVTDFLQIVNDLLKETLGGGEPFAVEGEVSGYRLSQGQWVSFDLKDGASILNIFMPVWQLNVPIEDGMTVRVYGLPRVYPKYGKFSFSAERIEIAGEGALRKALEALKKRLEAEGLFDESRKRELPRFPSRIALIASRESAAYGDFIRIVNERWRGLEIDLYHVVVQGEKAPLDIVSALQSASESGVDVVVMTRGGGSFEELMAFNDERVVRAVHASKIPTMVAIGHERDVTLAELTADVRGSTPTDCARRLVPDRKDILFEIATSLERMEQSLRMEIDRKKAVIDRALSAPRQFVMARRSELTAVMESVDASVGRWLLGLKERLARTERLLTSLDPSRVLSRGYAIVSVGGKTVTKVKDALGAMLVDIRFSDGSISAQPLNPPSRHSRGGGNPVPTKNVNATLFQFLPEVDSRLPAKGGLSRGNDEKK